MTPVHAVVRPPLERRSARPDARPHHRSGNPDWHSPTANRPAQPEVVVRVAIVDPPTAHQPRGWRRDSRPYGSVALLSDPPERYACYSDDDDQPQVPVAERPAEEEREQEH